MKAKWILAIFVLLLIAAQIIFGGKKTKQPANGTAAQAVSDSSDSPGPDAAVSSFIPPERPSPEDVVGVVIGAGEGAAHLEHAGDGWDVVGAAGAPADAAKVDRLLEHLLKSGLSPVPASVDAASAGTEDGLPVKLTTANGDFEMRVGIRPDGEFGQTYVRVPDGRTLALAADVRGELGLWKNTPDAVPEPGIWMRKNVLSFDPEQAVRLEADYPDHQIVFERSAGGEWEQRGYVPGGVWERGALTDWLDDLSKFRVSGVDGSGPLADTERPHEIAVTLSDGTVKRIRVAAGHGGEGMRTETSEYPGHVFILPEWRFNKYFRRAGVLFPKAVPHFDLADISFLDIRQDGETVKFAHRGGEWQAVATPYPARAERVERLARLLANWKPEDFANPDFKNIRPVFAGPMVEVILANGDVHQYRLAGRHPLFPWRYVIVDGLAIYSVDDGTVGSMFPGLAQVMDLGNVLPFRSGEDVRAMSLEDGDGEGAPLLSLERKENSESGENIWNAEAGDARAEIGGAEVSDILEDMLEWPVAGFFNLDSRPVKPKTMYHLRVTGRDGAERGIRFLEPEERDIPYVQDGGRAFLLDRKAFFNWLAAVRELAGRIPPLAEERKKEESELKAAEQTEADNQPEETPVEDAPAPLPVEEVASKTEEQKEESEEPVEEETPMSTVPPVTPEDFELSTDETIPSGPEVHIPLSEPSPALDADLVHPLPEGAVSPDGGQDGATAVKRFVDSYLGTAEDPAEAEPDQ